LRTGLVPPVDAKFFDFVVLRAWEIATIGTAGIAGLIFLAGSAAGGRAYDAATAQLSATAALSASAGTIVCIALMASLASVIALSPGGALPAIAGAVAALLLMPCCRVALFTLFPRFRSAEEVFRRK
jgi:hypothetical protein